MEEVGIAVADVAPSLFSGSFGAKIRFQWLSGAFRVASEFVNSLC